MRGRKKQEYARNTDGDKTKGGLMQERKNRTKMNRWREIQIERKVEEKKMKRKKVEEEKGMRERKIV